MSEEAPEWNALVQQLTAMAGCIGITIGVLRAKGVLTDAETDGIFAMTDDSLPANCSHAAAQTLAVIRSMARMVSAEES